MMDLSVVPYEAKCDAVGSPAVDGTGGRYRECMRNHAASMGGQAFDGCGEFMPSSGGDAFKCAACGCHRNFHRRDGLSGGRPLLLPPPPGAFPAYFPSHFPSPFARIPPVAAVDRSRLGSETPPRREERGTDGGGGDGSRKRFRTRFTAEQKEKMQAFAEKLGWRIQKHDDVALEEFCVEIGVKRHVLKVWMHNNKNHLSASSSATSAAADGGNPEPSPASAAAINV